MSAERTQPPNNPPFNTDPIAFSQAMIKAYERAAPVFEQAFDNWTKQDFSNQNFDPLNIAPIYAEFAQSIADNPDKFIEMQTQYWTKWTQVWQNAGLKAMGETTQNVIEPDRADRRFKDEDWQNNALFDFIKQSYLLTCECIEKTILETSDLPQNKKDKLALQARLYASAMSPSNFAMTNPEVLRETISTGGENLIKGFENLMKDLERGHGQLQISTTDYTAFKVGENIATTPGAVVYQNDLMQLIQYEPVTDTVVKEPLLIIPPWINKYYILDMRPENSLIKWAVEQGHTVFVISWINPGKELAHKNFEDYAAEGILDSITQIQKITGEPSINAVGYCIGGTLLSMTLAHLQDTGKQDCINSATFLTTLLDFEESGELKLFLDKDQVSHLKNTMEKTGLFEAKHLQQTFKLLRANDLIWSFVVNNYLMGKEPFPFDLLYWNDDSTNLPAAMQAFYLANMYQENNLIKAGTLEFLGTKVDLSTIKTPSYFLSTREDHIAPWQATYAGTKLFSGPVTFTLAASGHIAGIVSSPNKVKYGHWTSSKLGKTPDDWLESAAEQDGSWWPHWDSWLKTQSAGKTPARAIKKSIEPAPGSYVMKNAV